MTAVCSQCDKPIETANSYKVNPRTGGLTRSGLVWCEDCYELLCRRACTDAHFMDEGVLQNKAEETALRQSRMRGWYYI